MSESSTSVDQEIITLVKRAQGGDQDAYTQLFNQFHEPVLGYIYHTLHDRHAAEDVAQEAFIKAHDNLGQLGPPYNFKSWVFRIASNLAIDYVRGGKRIVNVEEDVMAYLDDTPSTQRPYERRLQQEERKEQVWRSLEGLPTHYRQALVMREFNDLGYREVAQALEVSYDNARQIVYRARTKFREIHGLRVVVAQAAQRCQVLGDMLSAFHDDELNDEQAEQVQQHLQTCEQCQQEQEEIKAAGMLLAGLPPLTATDAWKAAVLEEIRRRSLAGKPAATVRRPPRPEAGSGGSGTAAAESAGGAGGGGGSALASMMGGGAFWLLGGAVLLGALIVGGVFAYSGLNKLTASPSETPFVLAPEVTPSEGGTAVAGVQSEPSTTPAPPSATATRTPTPTVTATPTLGPPIALALQNSTCRAGPSAEQFGEVGYLLEGETTAIDGRSADDTYWWVENPDANGHCYIWKQLVEASGNLESVPFIPDPPTPTPPDEDGPSVSTSYSPSGDGRPTSQDVVTFSASASDESGISKIEIWVQGPSDNQAQLAATCQSSTSCQATGGPYSGGQVQFFARAVDGAGNQTQSNTQTIRIMLIIG